MNTTTIIANAIDATPEELIALSIIFDDDKLVQQAPTTETATLTGKAGDAVDAVKTAAGVSLNFIQTNKAGTIAAVGVVAVAGYAAYKWHKKRQEKKAEQAKAEEAKV